MKALRHPGNLILAGFVVMALGLLSLVYMATRVKFDMAVEGDYYQQEVNYDKKLAAEHTAKALGDNFSFKAEGSKLSLNLPAVLSAGIQNGWAEFFCLSDAGKDTKQALQKNADGLYVFNKETVAPGHNYIVKVSFSARGKDYYKEFRLQ
ncbi:MAG: hypothetical protein EOP54_03675 [Sphingobacteriales bacterium]|nr:MAG: hypothetical protein EOP54_03675 [Sphingobacteriales bacterium]